MIIKRRERSDKLIMRERVPVISKKRKSGPRSIRKRRKMTVPVLPSDIIQEILLRLPARDVAKSRLVCKLFTQLSWQPSFILKHMKNHFNASMHNTSLIMHPNASPVLYIHQGLKKNANSEHANSELIYFPTYLIRTAFLEAPTIFRNCLQRLEAACDGLLCFRKGKNDDMENDITTASFVIGNPLTREWMSVIVPMQSRHVLILGFYFHAYSGKYRLLLQIQYFCNQKPGWSYAVFELGPNTLRPINNSSSCNPIIYRGAFSGPVLIHGNLHWFGCRGNSKVISLLVVFNLEKEQFAQISIPDGFDDLRVIQLFEFEGKLCLFKLIGWPTVGVWVLKDYENGIWIKKEVVVRSGLFDPIVTEEQTYTFVVYAGDGQLLLAKPGFYDIASSEKKLTFYSLEISDKTAFEVLSANSHASVLFGKRYNETLASVGLQRKRLKHRSDSC